MPTFPLQDFGDRTSADLLPHCSFSNCGANSSHTKPSDSWLPRPLKLGDPPRLADGLTQYAALCATNSDAALELATYPPSMPVSSPTGFQPRRPAPPDEQTAVALASTPGKPAAGWLEGASCGSTGWSRATSWPTPTTALRWWCCGQAGAMQTINTRPAPLTRGCTAPAGAAGDPPAPTPPSPPPSAPPAATRRDRGDPWPPGWWRCLRNRSFAAPCGSWRWA